MIQRAEAKTRRVKLKINKQVEWMEKEWYGTTRAHFFPPATNLARMRKTALRRQVLIQHHQFATI
jgi:hypothetical protein